MTAGVFKLGSAVRSGLYYWSAGIVSVAGIRIEVQEKSALDSSRKYLFLANHQSALDIPILLVATLKAHDVRFMAKESLFRVPIWGWAMTVTGFIPVRREDARHVAERFKNVENALPYSCVIFPEGTRSDDGRLQPFKKGSIGLAMRLHMPIVPVTIVDACHALPKGTRRLRAGVVRLIFHPVIEPVENHRQERDAFCENISSTISSALPEDQKPMQTQPRSGETIIAHGASQ